MDTNDAQMSLGSDGIILSQEKDSKSVATSVSSDGKTSPTAPKTRTQVKIISVIKKTKEKLLFRCHRQRKLLMLSVNRRRINSKRC